MLTDEQIEDMGHQLNAWVWSTDQWGRMRPDVFRFARAVYNKACEDCAKACDPEGRDGALQAGLWHAELACRALKHGREG